MTEAILHTVDVNKAFGSLRASDNVSIEVRPGEFRAVIGPNGAGKSTFFNLISGFLKPDSGRIFMAGKDITGREPYQLFHSGLSRTFQITSIFTELAVLENMQIALLSYRRGLFDGFRQSRRMEVPECRRLLDLVGLDVDHDCRAGTLSHGDQKKLELAVALAGEPSLLLLDEPTAGMAANERLDSIKMVHRLAKKLGLTVVFTEHDMQVVFSVADRISVLHQGAIIADDVPEAIRQSPMVQQIYLGETVDGAVS